MNDVRGKEIKQGSLIVYPVRRGSFMELKVAHVSEVNEAGLVCYAPGKSRRIKIKAINRCAVVEN
jgi:hypothetical protein